jgi:hypothetical protein
MVATSEITKEDLELRIQNWLKRIHDLYSQIRQWLSHEDYKIKMRTDLEINEELMRDFHIPPRKMESLDILKNDKIIISLKPYGLWVIGANGRIDMLTSKGNYVIVDSSEAFEAPSWKMYSPQNPLKKENLTKEKFLSLIPTLS